MQRGGSLLTCSWRAPPPSRKGQQVAAPALAASSAHSSAARDRDRILGAILRRKGGVFARARRGSEARGAWRARGGHFLLLSRRACCRHAGALGPIPRPTRLYNYSFRRKVPSPAPSTAPARRHDHPRPPRGRRLRAAPRRLRERGARAAAPPGAPMGWDGAKDRFLGDDGSWATASPPSPAPRAARPPGLLARRLHHRLKRSGLPRNEPRHLRDARAALAEPARL